MSFKRIFAAILLMFSAVSIAFTPTAQQIEQFKKLPKSQQQALAKQYGINLSDVSGGGLNNPTQMQNSSTPSVFPRQPDEDDKAPRDPLEPIVEELEPFGYELFSGEPTSFAPTELQLVPNDYVIASGDTVTINLYGKESATHMVMVDREGRLNIPEFRPVSVVGLTYAELKQVIAEKVKNEAIGLSAFVSMAELRSIQVLIVGEAYRPGTYTLSPLSSVTNALFSTGGVTKIASLRNIEVKRQGNTIAVMDLYDLLLKGDSSDDITLQSGDVVFIPSVGPQVKVGGQVKRPAIFELKEGDTAESLTQMFGGFKEGAFLQRVQVNRVLNNAVKSVISVNFSESEVDYIPQGGDEIKVQAVNDDVVDSVSLIGAVARPGNYQWFEGATLKSYIEDPRTDLLPQADLGYSIIVRESEELGKIEVLQFSLSEALNSKGIPLQKNDEVFIFSRFNSQEQEESALKNLAMSAQEQELQKSVKLWHLYKRRQFENKVSFQQEEKDTQNKSTENNKETEKDKEVELEEDTENQEINENIYVPTVFGRETLLAPVLAQLEYQSSSSSESQIIEVLGQVRFPGIYPISKDMKASDAISAAGGLLESAYTEFAEITREQGDGQVAHIKVPLTSEGIESSINSRDVLNVLMKPNWQVSYRVTLKGEVTFPGEYIVKRGETLYSLLNRAGGLTEYAEPRAAVFTREAIKEQERKQLARLSDELRKDIAAKSFQKSIGANSSLSYSDANRLLKDLANVKALGRLIIDLPNIVSQADSLVLQDGDALYVPGKRESISIIGEVNYSSSHLFKSGTSIEEYITLSGGLRDRADAEKIYVIKANGAVFIPNRNSWFAINHDTELEAGDTIVVPMDSSHLDNLTLWSTATQIFYQLGVGVAAIARL
ncbi:MULTISPECIES: SLBB domain-containing protein [unclassified Pseudoalteromonas]|uniref:polysaccharide biosynthesis/export family protein n=1 Tax=unclassified Pseudoalteromonas TaxID=194690 RepID=UPI0020979C0B|nr:SLBB domain-containing protein [Pseudoalteromonas sp. XMcav2-N]MCO7188720.1 SLBB domain-containing protein [Pseudoalteromonas sp. XMcav2-N]